MIAIDTGKHVNLSEQDFMEHEKGIWHPDFLNSVQAHTDHRSKALG